MIEGGTGPLGPPSYTTFSPRHVLPPLTFTPFILARVLGEDPRTHGFVSPRPEPGEGGGTAQDSALPAPRRHGVSAAPSLAPLRTSVAYFKPGVFRDSTALNPNLPPSTPSPPRLPCTGTYGGVL